MIDLDLQLERNGPPGYPGHPGYPGSTLNVQTQWTQRATGLFGPSGSGKTTLLHLISGLLQPTRGRMAIHGETLFDSTQGINVPPHRRRVGLVFQQPRLLPHRNVEQNLMFPLRFLPRRSRTVKSEDVIKLLELRDLLKRRPHELSGGEAQRVSIGRALLTSPRVLLLDEPMTGLDLRLRQQTAPLLQRVRDELDIPMVYVTHDLDELLRFTDTLAVMDEGQMIGCGRYIDLSLDAKVLHRVLPTGLVNVLSMRVVSHDEERGLSVLRNGELILRSRLCDSKIGSPVSVSVRPEDIALSLQPVEGVSIQNQIPARIARHTVYGSVVIVELDAGADRPLLVEVSPGSFRRLELTKGKPITALVKSNALRVF